MKNDQGAMRYLESMYNRADRKRFAFPGTLVWGAGARMEMAEILSDAGAVDCYVDAHFAGHPLTLESLAPLRSRLRRTVAVAGEPRTQAVIAEADSTSSPDAIIAIGGGSTIDFAKAVIGKRLYGTIDGVGMGARRGMDPLPGASRPILLAAPTTAGTGADTSRYYVTYDAETKAKVHGKSWRLVADWSILDPAFLADCPPGLLVAGAFDAFTHLFESMVCRGEQSWFGQMLSLETIPRLIAALDRAAVHGERTDETHLELLYAASVGGMAISNVRTGNIHEAAGALLEITNLSHPETLAVFFASAHEQYAARTAPLTGMLVDRIAAEAPSAGIRSMDGLIAWWDDRLRATGALARIHEQVAALRPQRAAAEARIFERVWSDRVWVEKESPVSLGEADVRAFIARGLDAHGLAGG